jgi:hypothetical protein
MVNVAFATKIPNTSFLCIVSRLILFSGGKYFQYISAHFYISDFSTQFNCSTEKNSFPLVLLVLHVYLMPLTVAIHVKQCCRLSPHGITILSQPAGLMQSSTLAEKHALDMPVHLINHDPLIYEHPNIFIGCQRLSKWTHGFSSRSIT